MFSVSCPRCGSRLVYAETRGIGEGQGRWLYLLGLFNLFMGWLIGQATASGRTGYYRCFTCGLRWPGR